MSARQALEKFIRLVMRDTLYHGSFLAEVQSPSSGDTVDLLPDDPRIRGDGFQGVPVSYGLPGVKAKFSPGAKMLLVFENGDPRKPRAMLFDANSSHVEISFANGVQPFARVGDNVSVSVAIPSGSSAGTYPAQGQIIGGNPTVKG